MRIAEHLGSDTFVYAEADELGPLTVRTEGEAGIHPGDTIYLTPARGRVHRFDKDGRRIP